MIKSPKVYALFFGLVIFVALMSASFIPKQTKEWLTKDDRMIPFIVPQPDASTNDFMNGMNKIIAQQDKMLQLHQQEVDLLGQIAKKLEGSKLLTEEKDNLKELPNGFGYRVK